MKGEPKRIRRPTHAVVTVPDPDRISTCTHVEYGGTLQFRCEAPNYPYFEICFEVPGVSDDIETMVYSGSIDKPVVIHLTKDSKSFPKEGEYRYTVHHYREKPPEPSEPYAGPDTGTSSVFVKHCKAC